MKTTIKDAYKLAKKSGIFYVTFKDIEEPKPTQVWIIDSYDKAEREYLLYNWDNTSKYKYCKGDKVCFTEFYF